MSHSEVASGAGGRDATRRAILAAAATVFATRQTAGMAHVAAAAGVSRATLYRYFPTRESLFGALEAAANEEAGRRLADANLEQVPIDEALARATRALVGVGEDYIVLLRERRPPEPGFTAPLVALLERSREAGEIRTDVAVATLVESFLVLVGACVRTGKSLGLGSEDISSTALRLFSRVPAPTEPASLHFLRSKSAGRLRWRRGDALARFRPPEGRTSWIAPTSRVC